MRIHLPAPVPHRDPCPAWEPCAFTGKAWRLARMLAGQGHEVFVYGGPGVDCPGATAVQVIDEQDRIRWFGGQRYDEAVFDRADPTDPCWVQMNNVVAAAIAERLEPEDIIGVTAGRCQQAVADAFPHHVIAEVGVGYEGVLASSHRCFESYAWMHYVWGRDGVVDGRLYDVVIPNAYDPDDFFIGEPDGYLLFLGRMIPRKGLEVVAELAKRFDVITAGPGDGRVPGARHVGVVHGAAKARLLANARALIACTTYVEPFGGVAVEAMLSGTPVIASPFGAFTETVAHGTTGFLCHTLGELLTAADAVDDLDPKTIRRWATQRYLLEAAAPQYDRWLRRLAGLYGAGWYG